MLCLILHFLHGLSWELKILATDLRSLIDKLSNVIGNVLLGGETIFLPLIQPWPSFKILVAESSKASNTCAMMILNKGQKWWLCPPPKKKYWYYKCFRLLEKGHHVISNLHVLETSAIYTKLRYGHSFEKVITGMNACVNLKVTICPGGE